MKLGVIGAGKVGVAIAYVLMRRGVSVSSVSSTRKEALEKARFYLGDSVKYSLDNRVPVEESDVIAITTQDRKIAEVAKEIEMSFSDLKGKLFFHTSGLKAKDALLGLKEKGGRIGSIHPLQTFADVESAISALPETFIFIESEENSREDLRRLARLIGKEVYEIASGNKIIYHSCAVFVSNLLCSLLFAGSKLAEKIGLTLDPFFPLIDQTIRNVKEKGPISSLTGPVVRGDVETVSSHMDALRSLPSFLDVYRALSKFALEITRIRAEIDPKLIELLQSILEGGKKI